MALRKSLGIVGIRIQSPSILLGIIPPDCRVTFGNNIFRSRHSRPVNTIDREVFRTTVQVLNSISEISIQSKSFYYFCFQESIQTGKVSYFLTVWCLFTHRHEASVITINGTWRNKERTPTPKGLISTAVNVRTLISLTRVIDTCTYLQPII